jgi:hypothetical protein
MDAEQLHCLIDNQVRYLTTYIVYIVGIPYYRSYVHFVSKDYLEGSVRYLLGPILHHVIFENLLTEIDTLSYIYCQIMPLCNKWLHQSNIFFTFIAK